jgi:O-antigen ligase
VGLIFIGQVRLRAAILTMAAVGLSAGILTVVLFPNSALVVGLLNSFSDQTTYEARLSSWPQLIESSVRSGDLSVWFGQSFGSGFVRREPNGVVVSYSPHNWYLLLFLRVGLIGLVSFVTAMCWVLLRLIARRDPTPAVSFILTMSVFGWSYGITWALCVPFGWALAAAYSPGVPSDLTLRGARSSSYVGAPQDLRRVSPFDREPSRVNQDAK